MRRAKDSCWNEGYVLGNLSVSRVFKGCVVLTIWTLCTGAHWDALQVFAWAKMFVSNAAGMSLGEATARTFDPAEACDVCHWITDTKQDAESSSAFRPEAKEKQPLVILESEPVVPGFAATTVGLSGDESRLWEGLKKRVPTPPPRWV